MKKSKGDVMAWLLSREGRGALKKASDEVQRVEEELRKKSIVSLEKLYRPMTI